MIIYNKISLDIHNIASQLSLAVKRGDTSRGLKVILTDAGKPYTIPEKCYAVFSAKKSDGTFVGDGCKIRDNQIIYEFIPQLTTTIGRVDCDIAVYGEDHERITSPLFTLFVYETVRDEYEARVVSSDEFKILDDLISEATDTIAEAKTVIDETKAVKEEAEKVIEDLKNTELECELPEVTAKDNGKVLKVVDGAWTATEESSQGSGTSGSFTVEGDTLVFSDASFTVENETLIIN